MIAGLFHRAILLSGSALSSWAIVQEPMVYSLEIARQLNCTSNTDEFQNQEHIIDCLREIPIGELMKTKVLAPTFLNAFGPSIDGVVIKTNFQDEMLANMLPEWQTYSKSASLYGNAKVRDPKLPISTNKYDLLFGCVTSEALWRYKSILFTYCVIYCVCVCILLYFRFPLLRTCNSDAKYVLNIILRLS